MAGLDLFCPDCDSPEWNASKPLTTSVFYLCGRKQIAIGNGEWRTVAECKNRPARDLLAMPAGELARSLRERQEMDE